MTAAHPNPGTAPQNVGPTNKAAQAAHYRTRCMLCDNTGAILEHFVLWQSPVSGHPPKKHSQSFTDEELAIAKFNELLDQVEADPGTISGMELADGVRTCPCRLQGLNRKQASSTARQPKPTAPAIVSTAVEQHGPTHKQLAGVDRKTAAAGDREQFIDEIPHDE